MSSPVARRRGRWLALMLVLLPLSFVGAIACNFFAVLAVCGMSDCSGGGFGVRTDPQNPLPWRIASGVVLVLPIALVPHWLRWPVRLPIAALVAAGWVLHHL